MIVGSAELRAQTYAANIPDNVFDYSYQSAETWQGSKFREKRSFVSNSYAMASFSSDGIWGIAPLLGSSTSGIGSQMTYGYRLSPIYNVEASLGFGVLPYADWKVSRTDIDYYDAAFSSVGNLDLKAFFNITSYASRLEDPGRLELLYGAGLSFAYNGAFSVGIVSSIRLKYNITNTFALYVEPELAYYDNRLNGSSLASDNGNVRTSISAGVAVRFLDDYPLTLRGGSEGGGFSRDWEPTDRSVALSTNLIYWAMAIPNIGVEVPLHRKISVVGELSVPWYSNRNAGYNYQVMNGTVEGRYWFRGCFESGFFGGVGASLGYYDLQYDSKGVQSALFVVGGATGGYYQKVSSTMGFEFALSVGVLQSDNKRYEPDTDDGCLVYQSTESLQYLGATNARVALVWRPNFRALRKKK